MSPAWVAIQIIESESAYNCLAMGNLSAFGFLNRSRFTLPSGRQLVYARPRLEENEYGGHSVTYYGVGQNKKWCRLESYGPKFTENIIQAISRDILCYAMMNLRQHDIVMHIHDEVVIDAPPELTLEEVCTVMGQTPPWTPGLLLRADGYECSFYRKD